MCVWLCVCVSFAPACYDQPHSTVTCYMLASTRPVACWQTPRVRPVRKATGSAPSVWLSVDKCWPIGFVWKCWVYSQWNSNLIGIMISKTIGYNGVLTIFRHTQFTDSASLRRAKVRQKHFSAPAPPQFQCIHHRCSAITWLQQLRLDELVEVVSTWEVRSSCKIILSIVMGVVSQLYGV